MADTEIPVEGMEKAPNGHSEELAAAGDEGKSIGDAGPESTPEIVETSVAETQQLQEPSDVPTPTASSPQISLSNGQETSTPRTAEFFEQRMPASPRPRTDYQSTAATTAAPRPSTRSSLVFVVTA